MTGAAIGIRVSGAVHFNLTQSGSGAVTNFENKLFLVTNSIQTTYPFDPKNLNPPNQTNKLFSNRKQAVRLFAATRAKARPAQSSCLEKTLSRLAPISLRRQVFESLATSYLKIENHPAPRTAKVSPRNPARHWVRFFSPPNGSRLGSLFHESREVKIHPGPPQKP
jgi:hypothetical protein